MFGVYTKPLFNARTPLQNYANSTAPRCAGAEGARNPAVWIKTPSVLWDTPPWSRRQKGG